MPEDDRLDGRKPPMEAMMADPDNTPEDERIPVEVDDDETSTDPVEETDEQDPDAEDPDAEADADPDAPVDPDADPAPAAVRSRGDRQVGALREERRRLAEENARITRELNELRNAPRQPQQPIETAQQRADRLALLSPEERVQEMVTEALRVNEQKTQNLTNQLLEQSDAQAFQTLQVTNPLAKKLAGEVERRRQEYLRQGNMVPRSVILTYVVGERAMQQYGKGKPAAQRRRQAQEARPAAGRGDVAPPRERRGRGGDTVRDIEDRFGDVPI
jgi:predicted ATP-dependent protease